jgi:hypothetical protein
MALFLAAPAAQAKGTSNAARAQTAEVAPVAQEPAPDEQVSRDAREYAQREAAAAPLEKFEGGSSIVITGTALTVVLIILLVIVIL